MTLFSSRVLKVGTVEVDQNNKVVIDIGQPPMTILCPEDQNEDGLDVDGDPLKPAKPKIDLKRIEADARNQAQNIIDQAKNQADLVTKEANTFAIQLQDRILRQADEEAAQIREDAKTAGYNDGITAAQKEADAIKSAAAQAKEDAEKDIQILRESLEPEIIDLVTAVLEKLLGTAKNLDPNLIINLIRQGLNIATITGEVVIYVSPEDYEITLANKNELLALTDGSVKLEIIKDLSLEQTDCIIETPLGNVDASLNQQFEAIKSNLSAILNNS